MFERKQGSADLRAAIEYLRDVYHAMPGAVIVADPDGTIRSVNGAALTLLEARESELIGEHLRTVLDGVDLQDAFEFEFLRNMEPVVRAERTLRTKRGEAIPALFSASPMVCERTGRVRRVVCVALDLRERKRLELELRHSQRLEAVGRLGAGIAHEINTPVQFVGDGVHFLQGAFQDLLGLLELYRGGMTELAARAPKNADVADVASRLAEAEAQADLPYLVEQSPRAFERVSDGIGRIGSIVRAMREFSSPARGSKVPVDLNQAIRSTLVVARSEYKYVARLETEFAELPLVPCSAGELNQVLLHLIVNAAHAIADRKSQDDVGTIHVRTALCSGAAEISVSDTGCGIPEELRERVFEPFFTTKDPGRGSGQGLAIARAIIVERHGGSLTFDSAVGAGTTFRIRLPLESAFTLATPLSALHSRTLSAGADSELRRDANLLGMDEDSAVGSAQEQVA